MQEPISLKTLEQQAFRATLADGLWDVLLGCGVLMLAVAPLLSRTLGDFWSSFIFLPFWGAVYLGIWLARKRLVAPRLGQVQFGPTRRRKLRLLNRGMLAATTILLALGVVTLLLWEGPDSAGRIPVFGSVFPLGGSLVFLLGFSAAAYLLDVPRLYAYGLLLFAAFPVGEWLAVQYGAPHHGYPLVFGSAAAIIILAGLAQFAWLLKTYPPIPEA